MASTVSAPIAKARSIASANSTRSNISNNRRLREWRKKDWVVYSQAPFAGPRKLLDYLGRYTHRVAISNHRLLDCEGGQVRYHYRDRRDGDRRKTDVLPAEEFLHRFLQHVLPDHFPRIRHYGFAGQLREAGRGWLSAANCSACDRPRGTTNPTRPPTGCVSCWTSTSRGVPVAVPHCIGRNSSLLSRRRPSPAFRTANATSAPGTLPKPRFSDDPDYPSDRQNREPLALTAKALRACSGLHCSTEAPPTPGSPNQRL